MTVGANLVHQSHSRGLHAALRQRARHRGLQHCSLYLAVQVQSPRARSLPPLFLFTRMGHIQAGWFPPEPQWLEALRMGRQSGETVVSEYSPHLYHLFP